MKLKQRIYEGGAGSFKSLIVIGIAIFAVLATVLIAAFLLGELKIKHLRQVFDISARNRK